ncbi:DNA repair protein RecN [Muricomes sp. OA1]|uniref:DNA repair protein RecN n=1 Tax=Hungatella hathewayi TaxID=154046 RepID=A0A3E2X022_9FIRM|nr:MULTISPECIES: DNA repair protein RecN [Clostridia]MCH1973970.1 DNA repair protein RecN [Muricomes sp. OA1]RGC34434.1 DNA repair protein RecN [Hungatella hathewayi]GKH32743.1 DNA repair protein RecN [Faecalicatena contorta]
MLQNVHVKNLALIDEIEVEFQPGLNILTGETGAGKSIILGSVSLALGGRYSADMLRKGAQFGLVEMTFTVEDQAVQRQLEALDVFPEEGMLILSRKLMEGRSVSKINGETVSMSVLKDVASMLIDIHGQHEHQTLLHKKNHLALLDVYARDKVEALKKSTSAAYKEYIGCRRALEESGMDEESRKKEISLAEFEIGEIEEAGLQEHEDEELEALYQRMTESRRFTESIAEAYQYTSESAHGNASDLLSRAIRAFQDVEECDERGAGLYGQLLEIDSLLNDFNRELAEYAKSFEFSEEEYYETESRLNLVNHLKAKYGNTVNDVLEYCRTKRERLSELKDYESYIADLEEKYSQSEKKLKKHSDALSKVRAEASRAFAAEIKQGLADLNFLDVKFELRLGKTETFTANGMDEGEFYLSTNPGEPVKPLANVASGGELSRIMLAVKAVLADKEDTPTLIFDEIDTGISGITAGRVAEKMHVIGRSRQVICITHLPQIAAMADAHYLIQKDTTSNRTKTEILCLDEQESVRELARLLGGAKVTGKIMESAAEMKEMAKREI